MPFEHCDKDSSKKSKSFTILSSHTYLDFLLHSSDNDFHRVISALHLGTPTSLKFEVFADRLKLVRTVLRTNDLA